MIVEEILRYRLLIIVFIVAGLRGSLEVIFSDEHDSQATTLVSELYPDSAETHFRRGLIAMSVRQDDAQALRSFERALATGIKTNEDLLYNYALILILMKKDSKIVNAAITDWRLNFPNSYQPDPRIVAREIVARQMQLKSSPSGPEK